MAESSLKIFSDVTIEDIQSCWKVPAIAHFCSLFRSTFSLPDFEIEELEEALFLDAGAEQSEFITNLVVQLLRGIHNRKSITSDDYLKWLRTIMKKEWELGEHRVNPLNSEDVTFKTLPTLTKVEILHALCDYRLDAADVSLLKDYDGDNLRVEPLGMDRAGATYWYFYGTRLYKEDRERTQEERDAKHEEKLKEKRKRKAERLKAIKKLKDARKKQKNRKGKKEKSAKNTKKKKSAKNSDDKPTDEIVQDFLDNSSSSTTKKTKKGLKGKNSKSDIKPSSQSKTPRGTKNKKDGTRVDTAKTGRKNSNNVKHSMKSNSKDKQESTRTTSKDDKKKKMTEKKSKTEAGKRKNDTGVDKNQSKVKKTTGSSEKDKSKAKDKASQESPPKSRKRKVIKSKEIISDSEDDSDEDQLLTKVAKKTPPKKSAPKSVLKSATKSSSKSSKQKPDKKKATSQKADKTQTKLADASKDASKGRKKAQASAKKDKKGGKNMKKSSDKSEFQDVDHHWSSEEELCSSMPQTSETDTDSDSEDDFEPPRWHLVCHSQEDWEKLTEFFKKSKVKCERELYRILANDFLPEIHSLFASKEKALRKKLQEMEPRRASSRVVIMQLKREEEERLKSIEDAEQLRMKQQLEEEKQAKKEQRSKQALEDLDDESCSQEELSTVQKIERSAKKARKVKQQKDGLCSVLQQVYEAVHDHEDSWPFQNPVDEAYAPAYYQIIIKPMCLAMIQKKLGRNDYKTKNEFEQDMNQLFTNCLEYNGPGNEYTLMAENLKSCFDYNLDIMFPKLEPDSDDSTDETAPKTETYERPPQRQSAKNANSRLEKLDDKIYARLRGLSSSESSFLESQDSSRTVSEEEEDKFIVDEKPEDTNVDVKKEICDQEIVDQANSEGEQLQASSSLPYDKSCKSEDEAESSATENDSHSDISSEVDKRSPCSSDEDENASTRRNVIEFAPSLVEDDRVESDEKSQQDPWCKDVQFEPLQSNKDASDVHDSTQGPNLPPNSGPASSKVNRVKPVQNVRPYKPDGHSEERKDASAQHDLAESSHETQGGPAMIDLNSRRREIVNASNEFHVPLSNTDAKQTKSQGYFHDSLTSNRDFEHSIQTSGNRCVSTVQDLTGQPVDQLMPSANTFQSGHNWQQNLTPSVSSATHSGPQVQQTSHRSGECNKFDSANKLWHPLRVGEKLPYANIGASRSAFRPHVVGSPHERNLAVGDNTQSGSVQLGTAQLGTAQLGTAQLGTAQLGTAQLGTAQLGTDQLGTAQLGTTQLGTAQLGTAQLGTAQLGTAQLGTAQLGTAQLGTAQLGTAQLGTDQLGTAQLGTAQLGTAQLGTAPLGTAQLGTAQSRLTPSQSGNILQSLLHKNPHTSNLDQAKISTSKGVSEPAEMSETTVGASTSSHNLGPEMRQVEKVRNFYNPKQGTTHDLTFPAQKEMKVSTPQSGTPGHNTYPAVQTLNTNAFQSVPRQPEHMRTIELFPAWQQNTSLALGPQSIAPGQQEYRRTDIPQSISGQREAARDLNSMTSAGYLSMLAADSRSAKGQLGMPGYPGSQAVYGQPSLPIYNEQLRMHRGQPSTPYDYPTASHLSLFSPRPTLSGHSSSAFTLADPYSNQAAFRFQRPNQALYPQYLSREEADAWARRHYQQQLQHRSAIGSGYPPYPAQPTRSHPDMAYYTQHGLSGSLMSRPDASGVGTPMPYNPSYMPNQPHMGGYK